MDFVYSFASSLSDCSTPAITRHTGCLTCKRRHKKCDENRPRCQNCTRLNLVCNPPDVFRTSRLSRSHTRRSSHAHLRPGNVYNHELASSPDRSIRSIDEGNEDTTSAFSGTSYDTSCFHVNMPGSVKPALGTQSSPIEAYLMQHYIERLSSILINVDGPINSLKSISLPRMVASPMLTNALYATSACHLFLYEGKAEYQMASLRYYNRASSALRYLIKDLGDGLSVKDRELMLLTSVFLCKYDIISGELKSWRPHLLGLQKMFTVCQHNGIKVSEEMVSYIQSFIAYHWYIAGITKTADSDEALESELVLNSQIDPYMGVSGRYISLLNSVAQLVTTDSAKGFDMDTTMNTAMKAFRDISSDLQDWESFNLPIGMTSEMCSYLKSIANGYRNAVIIYLHIVLERYTQSHSSDARALQFLLLRSLLPCTKDEAISACLADILRVPENNPAAIGSCPLLFIVASETRDRSEFRIAFQLLMQLWTRTYLGNTGIALDFLRLIQEANFPDWRQMLRLRKWDLIVS